jgi:hypothetical protein
MAETVYDDRAGDDEDDYPGGTLQSRTHFRSRVLIFVRPRGVGVFSTCMPAPAFVLLSARR